MPTCSCSFYADVSKAGHLPHESERLVSLLTLALFIFLLNFAESHFLALWFLEGVALVYEFLDFAFQPVKLLVVIIMRRHLTVLLGNEALYPLPLFMWRIKHALGQDNVLVALLREEVEEKGLLRVPLPSQECLN